jgi:hypothetical protein
MLKSVNSGLRTGLGVVMLVLGAFVFARLFISGMPPLTRSRLLDSAFAAFFILRGVMNLRLRRRSAGDHRPPDPGAAA